MGLIGRLKFWEKKKSNGPRPPQFTEVQPSASSGDQTAGRLSGQATHGQDQSGVEAKDSVQLQGMPQVHPPGQAPRPGQAQSGQVQDSPAVPQVKHQAKGQAGVKDRFNGQDRPQKPQEKASNLNESAPKDPQKSSILPLLSWIGKIQGEAMERRADRIDQMAKNRIPVHKPGQLVRYESGRTYLVGRHGQHVRVEIS